MKKFIKNLEDKVSSVLYESLVDDVAELVGIEQEDAEERITGLSFANYLELGNAVDIEDAETAREILGTVAPLEEDLTEGGGDFGFLTPEEMQGLPTHRLLAYYKAKRKENKKDQASMYYEGDGAYTAELEQVLQVAKEILNTREHLGENLNEWGGLNAWEKMFGDTCEICRGDHQLDKDDIEPYGEKSMGDQYEMCSHCRHWWDDIKANSADKREAERQLDLFKESFVDEEKLLDVPTPTLKDLAKKHDVSLADMGVQLAKGIKAEKEHTTDMLVAKEIALDHLNELPDYYDRLEKMEEGKMPKVDDTTPDGGVGIELGKCLDCGRRRGSRHKDDCHVGKNAKQFQKTNEADNPYASPPSAGSSIDAIKAAAGEVKSGIKGTIDDMKAMYQAGREAGEDGQLGRKDVEDLTVGDDIEVIDIDGDPTAVTVKTPQAPGDTLVVQTDKGEEHIVKKQAVSGTPELNEGRVKQFYWEEAERMTREEFVAKYGEDVGEFWDNVHGVNESIKLEELASAFERSLNLGEDKFDSWAAEDADVAEFNADVWSNFRRHKNWPGGTVVLANGDLRKAVRARYKQEGWTKEYPTDKSDHWFVHPTLPFKSAMQYEHGITYITSMTTLSPAESVAKYDGVEESAQSDLFIGSTGAAETDPEGVWKWWTGRGQTFWRVVVTQEDWDLYALQRTNLAGTKNLNKPFYRNRAGVEQWLNDCERLDEPMYNVEEARNASNTEHSGAKKGKGGYYGRKKDAKSDSNKKRRANDKKAIDEANEFSFYVEPDGRGGGTVMTSNGDIHDYYDDAEDARLAAEQLNAEYGQVDEGLDKYLLDRGYRECPVCDGSGLSDDPDNWELGDEGECGYCGGFGRLMPQNQRRQSDLFTEEIKEMQRMAGIQETASGGATGAGAVAVGATAVGGPYGVGGSKPIKRQVSKNPSIYGKTNKKPQPKKRTKESADDGIGRGKKE